MKRFEIMIDTAIKESISDIHITGEHPVVSRKNGDIQFHGSLKWTHQEIDDLTRKLLTPLQLDRLRQKKSVDISVSTSNARIRVNIFTTVRGISIAIRILPGRIPTIEELNLHPSLHDISKIKFGLVLICGGTGEGKTTTIAAIINDINKSRQAHIVTIEDPVEYRFQSKKSFIEQREIGPHTPSFKQGLIDVLREDADVIVVGELREGETMQLALNAAESGHLVIATMHASTPEEAIYRMCNAVPIEAQTEVRNQLASSLAWITVQQLEYLEKAGQRVPVLTIAHGTQAIKNLIRENKLNQINNAIDASKNMGMFLPERYLTHYLNTRSDFNPYGKIFRPSAELSPNDFYQSPLTGEPEIKYAAKQEMTKPVSQTIIDMSESSDENVDNILDINDNISLDKIVEKLNKNSE
jgi:twitching motility protein PilT